MKEFLKTQINWKTFIYEMFGIFVFFLLSYWAGNNKFPHNFWIVFVGTIGVGIAIIYNTYMRDKIKKEKNGQSNR